MTVHRTRHIAAYLLLSLYGIAAVAAAQPPARTEPLGAAPVSRATLAALRGGYSIGNSALGIELSFAITRVSYINGQLVAQNALALPSGGSIGMDATTALPAVQVIQNGPGNTFSLSGANLPSSVMTVIQNTLDNQVIKNATIIDATVTSRRLVHSIAVSSAIDQAITRSLR